MKKIYAKPEISFESFTLSTNIAANCDFQTNTPSENQCGIDFSGVTIFLDIMSGVCVGDGAIKSEGGDGEYNGICYHVSSNGQNIFTS